MEFARSPSGAAAMAREQIVASHVQDSNDPRLQMIRRCGVRAYFCSPLLAEGRLLGTLSFGSRRRDAFDPDEIEFLQTISRYVTIASQRARLVGHLRDTDRRKDEFLATLAHELRNPLAPIRNALQIMALAEDGAAVDQARRMMERQLVQMVRLIDDLLDVSRITIGKLELRKERVDIASILASAIETARPLIDACGHSLHVSLPPAPVYLDADPLRLAQVFSNLLNNAAKYMDRGGRIDVEAEEKDGELRVTVRDTGRGIPAEALPHVFEMFAQVDRSLEHSHGGLGIGLTLAKRLVELHGGTIEARSGGPGQGSTFTVRLPSAAPAGTLDLSAGEQPQRLIQSCRILIADDNPDAVEMLNLMLSLHGHAVTVASDGVVAVSLAASIKPQIAFLDIGMPRMDGYEAARQIRQTLGPDVMLVALTGWGQDEDKRRSKEAGFDHHLTKPPDPEVLERLIAECAKRER